MSNRQAKALLSYVINHGSQIDHAVQMAYLVWRKNQLIKQFENLMQEIGIPISTGIKQDLSACESILDLTESMKEFFLDLLITARKRFKNIQFYPDFIYAIGLSLDDWLRKHKDKITKEITSREKLFKQDRAKVLKEHLKASFAITSDHAVSEQRADLELLSETEKVLVAFISVAYILQYSANRYDRIPSQLVPLDDGHGILLTADHIHVYNLQSLHQQEHGITSHLAIYSKDGIPELEILQMQNGYLEKIIYIAVEPDIVFAAIEANAILQDRDGNLFALHVQEVIDQESNQFITPIIEVNEEYVLDSERKILLSTPLVEIEPDKFVSTEFIPQPLIMGNKKNIKPASVQEVIINKKKAKKVSGIKDNPPEPIQAKENVQPAKLQKIPQVPVTSVVEPIHPKTEVHKIPQELPTVSINSRVRRTAELESSLSSSQPEPVKAQTIEVTIAGVSKPNLMPANDKSEQKKLTLILGSLKEPKKSMIKRRDSFKMVKGSRVLQLVTQYEEMIEKQIAEAEERNARTPTKPRGK